MKNPNGPSIEEVDEWRDELAREDYAGRMKWFVDNLCVGKQYDSCINTPCTYSGGNGCTHPKHPKFKP
jgi:hypothetical protein